MRAIFNGARTVVFGDGDGHADFSFKVIGFDAPFEPAYQIDLKAADFAF